MAKSGKFPHTILFTGPSGCGKTTIARILRKKVKCDDFDFIEMNASESRGIDTVRDIKSNVGKSPMGGKSRVFLIDECHQLTPDAQNALLKVLEDTPDHVYFFLATTDPQKLKTTVRTRCHEVVCKPIPVKLLLELMAAVCSKEEKEIDDKVLTKIADVADGSARKALVILNGVIGLPTIEEQLAAIESGDTQGQAIELARALIRGAKWGEVSKIVKSIETEEPEGVRHLVLAYCRSVLLNKGDGRAAAIMACFQYNFFDTKKAGLALAAWDACNAS